MSLIGVWSHQKKFSSPDRKGKLRTATPIFDRGNFSAKLWNHCFIGTTASGYSTPMFFDTTNRLEASILLPDLHLTYFRPRPFLTVGIFQRNYGITVLLELQQVGTLHPCFLTRQIDWKHQFYSQIII